jgi:hypothetical protein
MQTVFGYRKPIKDETMITAENKNKSAFMSF